MTLIIIENLKKIQDTQCKDSEASASYIVSKLILKTINDKVVNNLP